MNDFLGRIFDAIQYLWPFVIIHPWERGCWYVCGRQWRVVGPGLKLRLPFFMDIHDVPIVPWTVELPEITITTQGGGTLTARAVAELQVINASLAFNAVLDHEHKATLDLLGVLSDTLAELDEERLEPEKRRGVIRRCIADADKVLGVYGTQVNALRFILFQRNMKTYRLIGMR